MKQFKAKIIILITFLIFIAFVPASQNAALIITAEAHSGRTDAYGGHHDYKNASGLGSYHYHCGGHPAHLHKNGVCPYSSSKNTVSKIKLSKTSATLTEGKYLQLKITGTSKKITWTSSNKSVATVSSKGKVTAKGKGTATITAKIGSKRYTCKLTVKALTLNKTNVTLTEGQSTTLKLDTNNKIKWTSSDKKIATVNSKGKVSAKKAGEAIITANIGKKKYQCKITVSKKLSKISLNGITIKTADWLSSGNEICFFIQNNTSNNVIVYKTLKAYDDDAKFLGSMEQSVNNSTIIPAGNVGKVTFSDLTYSDLIYYSQRLVFTMTVNNTPVYCYAEYSYNDDMPYKFTFYKS